MKSPAGLKKDSVMAHDIENRLAELGVELPGPPAPAANYLPCRIVGGLVYISGQLPFDSRGGLTVGRLGENLNAEEGKAAACLCAKNLLAQLRAAVNGDWNRVGCAVKLAGMVNSKTDFTDQPTVINGASEFLIAAMGEAGRHARTAVGVSSLPLGAAVEVDGIFSLR